MTQFLDYCKIWIESGKGGNGCVSFRREKYVPLGGPFGGDGGRGGSVFFKSTNSLNTLLSYAHKCHFHAENGKDGRSKLCHGKNGKDLILKVPVGTQIFEEDGITLIADLSQDGQIVRVLKGGKGGHGNYHFKSSTNQAPMEAIPGCKKQEKWVVLKLKYIGDIGLVGKPNAGKSTFLSIISNAKPKIADYPFTTVYPNLGIVSIHNHDFTIVDIPGLIKNSSQGKGLGYQFLQHIERCSTLACVISINDNILKTYQEILDELKQYDSQLINKIKVIFLTKADLFSEKIIENKLSQLQKINKIEYVIAISAKCNYHITEAKQILANIYQNQKLILSSTTWHPLKR